MKETNSMITTASRQWIRKLYANMAGRVKYRLGAKVSNLWSDSHKIEVLDCSGFIQFIIFRASFGGIKPPDGSVEQNEYCVNKGWIRFAYADVLANRDTERYFICFLHPKPGKWGHVWFVSNGHTYECYGSHGVGSRVPTMSFPAHCDACFEVPTSV